MYFNTMLSGTSCKLCADGACLYDIYPGGLQKVRWLYTFMNTKNPLTGWSQSSSLLSILHSFLCSHLPPSFFLSLPLPFPFVSTNINRHMSAHCLLSIVITHFLISFFPESECSRTALSLPPFQMMGQPKFGTFINWRGGISSARQSSPTFSRVCQTLQ